MNSAINAAVNGAQSEGELTLPAAAQPAKPGFLSSLWQDAYEHPVRTGLEVGGAALMAGAALYATKGRIASLFRTEKPDVLLIEDTPALAKAFKFSLEEQGHNVTWVTGIKQLEPLTGLTPEGKELALEGSNAKVALVDGDLGKGNLAGADIVGTLKQKHILSIGTSAVDGLNTAMQANGAEITSNKSVVLTSLLSRQLDLTAALRAPDAAQQALSTFRASLLKPENQALRHSADDLVMKYMRE